MNRAVSPPVLAMLALVAGLLGSGCAEAAAERVVQAPVPSRTHARAARPFQMTHQDLPSDRDARVEMPGKVIATELPEYRNGEGANILGTAACGIVPEDRR